MHNLSSASRVSSSAGVPLLLPKKRGRPSLPDLIVRAVSVSAPRKGASVVAIKKALLAAGYDVQKNNGRLKATLSSLVSRGILQRVTGSGASGSFRVKNQEKGGVAKKAKEKTALKRVRIHIAARRSPKKINLSVARKAKGAGRETKPAVKRPKAGKSPASRKGRGAVRGKVVKRH